MGGLGFFSGWFNNKRSADLQESIYAYSAKAIDGREILMSHYRGKPMMIVNTASKCGFTHQYASLQQLHQEYGDRLTILGFPSNDFMWQEPGSNENIASFCSLNYGVTFQMFEKISVKGKNQHPLFYWLEVHARNRPTWNFCKYLVDKEGKVTAFFPAKVDPLSAPVTEHIMTLV